MKTKSKKPTVESLQKTVEVLEKGVFKLEKGVLKLEVALGNCRKHVGYVEAKLKSFINKQTAEIRTLGDDGKWGDYTGVFYVDSKNDENLITEKAMTHYETYFQDVEFYKKRTLGLFITNLKGKKLIKVLQDNEKKLEQNGTRR